MAALDKKGLEDEDIIYGTSTIRKYLKKFHGVEISDADLNDRFTEMILEEIEEAEVNPINL